jgi:hypothetical protein
LDHIIAVNERHLRRLLFDYVRYHHEEDRTHLGLGKGTPAGRICSANAARVTSHVSAPGKAHDGGGRDRKQQQYDPIGGIAHCETSVGLEQECSENQASHHSDKQARDATPEVTDRYDQEQKCCRDRWF